MVFVFEFNFCAFVLIDGGNNALLLLLFFASFSFLNLFHFSFLIFIDLFCDRTSILSSSKLINLLFVPLTVDLFLCGRDDELDDVDGD